MRIDELGAKYEHARAEGTRLRGRIVESERAASEAGIKLGEAEITSRELSSKVWQNSLFVGSRIRTIVTNPTQVPTTSEIGRALEPTPTKF